MSAECNILAVTHLYTHDPDPCLVVSGGPHLELGPAYSRLVVAEEGDERRPTCVLLVVVLGAVLIGQLDHAVVVGQLGIELPETP